MGTTRGAKRTAALAGTAVIISSHVLIASPPPPPSLVGDPSVHPADFRVTTFASGVPFPTSMQQLSDGSLLVGSSVPITTFFNSTGQLLRFVDANHDGVADGPATVLASGLPGGITSVRQAGNLLLVTSAGASTPTITVLRQGATPASPYSTVGSISLNFPANWEHLSYALATRPTPGQPGDYDVVFNVGSQGNNVSTPASNTVSTSGLVTAALNPDSLYKATIHDTGVSATVSNVTQLATGLRNAAGIAFAPNGDLWFEDNGMDGGNDIYGNVAFSADELNRIPAAEIGTSIKDFGFAGNYVRYSDGAVIGGGTQPVVAFLPINGSESEGPNEIAFTPAAFPAGLNHGVLVGFHGQFDKIGNFDPNTGAGNEENPVVFYNQDTNSYFHLIENTEPFIGHPDGLLSTADSVFIADMADGSVFGTASTGAIYQISAVPEPGGAVLAFALTLPLLARRRAR